MAVKIRRLGLGSALVAVLLLVATAPAMALSLAEARHLVARTGFGLAYSDIAPLLPLSREQAVDAVLATLRATPTLPLPSWADAPGKINTTTDAQMQELAAWWVLEMAHTTSPITERLVLLWTNHFVSAAPKVADARLLLRQNLLLRRDAAGSFGTLLHDIAHDPAMLLYLDGATNVARAPNENFAREVMELFTLGVGHYTETDVRELARALTGWTINGSLQFVTVPANHDGGVKTILGQSGNFDGDQGLDIVLAQPSLPVFILSKLWTTFVSPTPDADTVQRLATGFAQSGLMIQPALRALLLTDAFWDPANRGTLIKSPVELAFSLDRVLGLSPAETASLPAALANMGQGLFHQPDVKGWRGYTAWINTDSAVRRNALIDKMLSVWSTEVLPTIGNDFVVDAATTDFLQQWLLPTAPLAPPLQAPARFSAVLGHLLFDPAFQLN